MSFVLIVCCALFSPVAALAFARLALGRRWAVTPLILFVGISSVFVQIGFITNFIRYSREPWAWNALGATSLGIFCVGLGGLLGALLSPPRPARAGSTAGDRAFSYFTATWSAVAIFGVVLLYFKMLGYIPMVEGVRLLLREGFVSGLVNTFRINRDVYFNPEASYIPFQGFMEIVRYVGLPIVAVWFLHFARVGCRRRLSLSFLATCVILTVLSGQRWPLMNMLIAVLVYYSWTETGLWRHTRRVALICGAGLIAGTALSALLGRTAAQDLNIFEMIGFGSRDLLVRIFTGNADIPFLSYSLFPGTFGWLHGQSWLQNLQALLPGPAPSFPVTFHQMVTGSGRGFTAPPDFYTEAFINFGFAGVTILSFAWGVVLSLWNSIVTRTIDGTLGLSIQAVIVTMLGYSAMTGASFLIGGIIVVTFVIGLTSVFETARLTFVRRIRLPRVAS